MSKPWIFSYKKKKEKKKNLWYKWAKGVRLSRKSPFLCQPPSSFFRWCHLFCSLHYTSSLEHSIHNQKRGGGGHCQQRAFSVPTRFISTALVFSLVLLNSLLWAKIIRLNEETQLFTFMSLNSTWYELIEHNAILCKWFLNITRVSW